MTDAEREALVERMAKTAYLTAYPTRGWETAPATERRRWRRVAVSLLAVAEPVVREDERQRNVTVLAKEGHHIAASLLDDRGAA